MTTQTANADSNYLWWRDGVIYQIYPRSFVDSNGDGVGDLPGILSRLDYIASLGVDAIWLSPINTSPMHDFGYDISDYEDIDPVFGTRADFETLIAEAHRRELKIVMDLVINHTSIEHPWFKESRASRSSPKADWYIWRDAPPGKKYPNNTRCSTSIALSSGCANRRPRFAVERTAPSSSAPWRP